MRLTQCPYDGATVLAHPNPTGSVNLECPACEAIWQYHTNWVTQLRKPDRNKLRAARRRAPSLAIAEHADH